MLYTFIYNLNIHPYFVFFVSISSILGLFISVYLIYKSSSIAKILNHMTTAKDYNTSRTQFIERFKGYKASILKDDVKTKLLVHDILEDIYKFEVQYKSLLSKSELFKIYFFKLYLRKTFNKLNFDKICNNLDFLIGRFHKREEE